MEVTPTPYRLSDYRLNHTILFGSFLPWEENVQRHDDPKSFLTGLVRRNQDSRRPKVLDWNLDCNHVTLNHVGIKASASRIASSPYLYFPREAESPKA